MHDLIKTTILIIGLFLPCCLLAQTAEGLLRTLASTKTDSNRVHILHQLSAQSSNDIDIARDYLTQAIGLSQDLDYDKGIAVSLTALGQLEVSAASYVSGLEYFERALSVWETIEDKPAIAKANYHISKAHEKMGNYSEALKYMDKNLSLVQELENPEGIAQAYQVIGDIKTELEKFEDAYDAYNKALDIRQKNNDTLKLVAVYSSIGNSFDERGETNLKKDLAARALPQFHQAISYYEKAIDLCKESANVKREQQANMDIALIYKNLGSYYLGIEETDNANSSFQTALTYLDKSLAYRESVGDELGMVKVYNGIGDVKRRQGDFEGALDYAKRYFAIATQRKDQKYIQTGHKDMARAYAGLGQYKEAYANRKAYDELRYKSLEAARIQQNQRLEDIYIDRKKEAEYQAKQHLLELEEARIRSSGFRQRTLIGGALALLALIALILYNRKD